MRSRVLDMFYLVGAAVPLCLFGAGAFMVADIHHISLLTLLDNATTINSPIFGQITTPRTFRGAAPRIGQLAARLTF